MKRENFYRRDPGRALAGMATMTLEERGVYNTVIDLLYLTWRPIEDNAAYIAGHCNCAVQKLNPILNRLIARGKLVRFTEGGQSYLSNPTFDDERSAVKGDTKTKSGRGPDRGEVEGKSASVEEKSASVTEKSESVTETLPLLEDVSEENQTFKPLDKTRQDKTRQETDTNVSVILAAPDLVGFTAFWAAYPRKTNKRPAVAAYRAAIKRLGGPDPLATILAGVERYRISSDVQRGYVKHPATWLNADCWEDEPQLETRDGRIDQADRRPTDRDEKLDRMRAGMLAATRAGGGAEPNYGTAGADDRGVRRAG